MGQQFVVRRLGRDGDITSSLRFHSQKIDPEQARRITNKGAALSGPALGEKILQAVAATASSALLIARAMPVEVDSSRVDSVGGFPGAAVYLSGFPTTRPG